LVEYRPTGAWYDATYVVFAVIGTADEKLASCHPLAVSPLKTTLARFVPVFVHRFPIWVPVLPVPL
jgi:hypothetical protein